jgi:F-type H+-transporting ATPase subunit b
VIRKAGNCLRACMLLVPGCAVALALLPIRAHAASIAAAMLMQQDTSATQAGSGQTETSNIPQDSSSAVQSSAEPKSEDKNKEDKDETAEFKRSESVRWLAKITGLSLQQAYMLGVGLNFALLAGTIFWFAKKGLPKMFRARTASIQQAMLEARKASEEARRRLTEIETRLSRLDSEIEKMRASAEKEAAAEEERIKAAAQEDARRIVESAEHEIAAAAKAARRELTKHAADLAVSLAQRQIHVDAATDQRLLREFADELSTGGRKGRA